MSTSLLVRSSLPRALAHRAALRSVAVQARANSTVSEHKYVAGGPIPKGGPNDAVTFPPPSPTHGSYHWVFERTLAAALVPLTAAAFVTSGTNYPILDGVLGLSLIAHSHIGFDQCIVDYLHPRKFPILGPASSWTLRAATLAATVGIFQFNTNDIGLTELIAKVWTA
ncbi:mitochondrial inner membrane protein [Ephemerocybe angulata]|uniref:Succinate dehydrogenase [ubiquinone] cytochrome b small subunit n=1 Tax=Ephemerocybe angulata TaxID=980116 RepID=A0A8H6HUI8_9AGAR|nr:mitochondrial inner membrane protein [Tulosesus angulatus]